MGWFGSICCNTVWKYLYSLYVLIDKLILNILTKISHKMQLSLSVGGTFFMVFWFKFGGLAYPPMDVSMSPWYPWVHGMHDRDLFSMPFTNPGGSYCEDRAPCELYCSLRGRSYANLFLITLWMNLVIPSDPSHPFSCSAVPFSAGSLCRLPDWIKTNINPF